MTVATIGNNTGDTYSGTDDTRLRELAPTTPHGNDAIIEVDKYSSGNHYNSLIRFTGLSSIGSGATVSSASLWIKIQTTSAGGVTWGVRRCLRAWVESEATWNIYSTGNSWTAAGGLSDGNDRIATAAVTKTFTPSTGGWVEFTDAALATLVEGWINGTITNNGVILERDGTGNDGNYSEIYSSEGTDGSRPYLSVTYTAGAGGGTVTADQGSFALTGQTAGLLFNRTLIADVGAFALTGQAATLTYVPAQAFSMPADVGSFALTGQTVTLQKDTPGQFTLQVDAGSYAWTGNEALVDSAMNGGQGSYTLTGQDVTFTRGYPQAYSLSVDVGSYTFNGQNARLDWSGAPVVPNRQAGIYMGIRIGL